MTINKLINSSYFKQFNTFYKNNLIRIFDIIFSLFVLIIFSPFWIIISLLIKLDSKGPILFKQIRVGKNGKFFQIYKFRTMVINANKLGPLLTEKNDKRITKIGKILRLTSLDEIPNFINVLKGEMSVIGPRPEVPEITSHYSKWQRQVFKVKPGITGFSQILGRQELEIPKKLRLDIYYIKKQNICFDLWILYKTIFVVLTGKGVR